MQPRPHTALQANLPRELENHALYRNVWRGVGSRRVVWSFSFRFLLLFFYFAVGALAASLRVLVFVDGWRHAFRRMRHFNIITVLLGSIVCKDSVNIYQDTTDLLYLDICYIITV